MIGISELINFILHFDKYLAVIIQEYGFATHFILFLIVFFETGVVITPFLPGDSLLFIAGTFAAQGTLNVFLLFFILSIAAILGDSVNYFIGNYCGKKCYGNRLIKKEYLDKTQGFYDKYGGKTIIIARFIPIVRTLAPFVAGVGKMPYIRFFSFNVIGGIAWVGIFVFGGYYFGQAPFVQNNLSLIIIVIIILSILPAIIEYLRERRKK